MLVAVFVVGFGLYGAILALAGAEDRLLERGFRARWTVPGLPRALAPSVSVIGTAGLLLAGGTGLLLLDRGAALHYWPKLASVLLAFVLQLSFHAAPRRALLLLHLGLLLLTVALAVALAR